MSALAHMASALMRAGELQSCGSRSRPDSMVQRIRRELIAGPKTSAQLERLLGLTNQQIWGRLKRDIDAGRVVRIGDQWCWQSIQPKGSQ